MLNVKFVGENSAIRACGAKIGAKIVGARHYRYMMEMFILNSSTKKLATA